MQTTALAVSARTLRALRRRTRIKDAHPPVVEQFLALCAEVGREPLVYNGNSRTARRGSIAVLHLRKDEISGSWVTYTLCATFSWTTRTKTTLIERTVIGDGPFVRTIYAHHEAPVVTAAAT